MTSPGLKRPLEFEPLAERTGSSASANPNEGATGGGGGVETNQSSTPNKEPLNKASNVSGDDSNASSINGNKRRCTTNNHLHRTGGHNLTNASPSHQSTSSTSDPGKSTTPYGEPSSLILSLSDTIASLIDEELQRDQKESKESQTSADNKCSTDSDCHMLTTEQTQTICKKLIIEMDKKLRDDYDRILARKLAEQYDIFAKANYLNSFVDSKQRASSTAGQAPTSPPTPTAGAPTNPSVNAFAAALRMQRSVSASSQPVTTTPNSLNDLNQFAASLNAANGHPSAITSTPHHLSYNSFQQQVAAAAAATAALQHQAAVQHHGHHQQQSSLQQSPHLTGHHRVAASVLGQANAVVAGAAIPNGPVLLTSNLDEQLATPEALFTLFGVFGDVIRVKILFNKKDNALIQMADATQAQVAQGYLDKQRIFGKNIRVTRSRHQLVQMPRDGNQSDAGLTKDFTNSPLHRFKIPGSRNYLNIYPPSNTLHISNIPATVDESDLHKAFKEQCNFEFTSFKFFPKDRKMALMKFVSTEHATIALIKMHNFQISEENILRVSFSKTLI